MFEIYNDLIIRSMKYLSLKNRQKVRFNIDNKYFFNYSYTSKFNTYLLITIFRYIVISDRI